MARVFPSPDCFNDFSRLSRFPLVDNKYSVSCVIIYFYGSHGIRQIVHNFIFGWWFIQIMAISSILPENWILNRWTTSINAMSCFLSLTFNMKVVMAFFHVHLYKVSHFIKHQIDFKIKTLIGRVFFSEIPFNANLGKANRKFIWSNSCWELPF